MLARIGGSYKGFWRARHGKKAGRASVRVHVITGLIA